MMGEVTFCQVSIFFSLVGLLGSLLTWPVALALILTGAGEKRIKKEEEEKYLSSFSPLQKVFDGAPFPG